MIENVIAVIVGIGFVGTLIRFRSLRDGSTTYDSRLAWHRALLYFCGCLLVSRASGVLGHVLHDPIVRAGQRSDQGWVALTALAVIVIVIAYGYVWPIGTRSHGRPLHLPVALGFGLAWGFCEGQLFASFWWMADRVITQRFIATLVAYGLIAAWSRNWHLRYWDVHVAPLHNIDAWNTRKVLFAHTPNLIVTLTHLALYRNVAMFVAFQTLGLTISTVVMRFPAYGAPGIGSEVAA